ncbi:RnfH family protein [Paludibacterium yongneupense]|uniref:RnfH family protein n=1 Tax=Paludibacterium yongneupense TaxID=400061 RepID=UPI00048C24F3|nr:RnfH family protein [Paludibacterium yongneupense]
MSEHLTVEVAYACPEWQQIVVLEVEVGTSALEAVQLSGLLARAGDIDAAAPKLGIFGKAVAGDTVLREGDRVELYRPLLADPKEVRRRRAAQGRG